MVGSTMVDMVAYSPRIPVIGETIFGTKFEQNYGGKGANQVVMVANMETQASMFCKVGADAFGSAYVASLRGMGVTVHALTHATESTGIACITVDEAGSNSIVIIPGANVTITEEEVLGSWAADILQCRVVVCQNEITSTATKCTLQMIRDHNRRCAPGEGGDAAAFVFRHPGQIVSVFNPAPVADPIRCLECALLADIVCPNEVELGMLAGMPADSAAEIEAAARRLLELGCGSVVVTLGARGACIACPGEPLTFVPAPVLDNCVDTVGAGDCFIGSLASRLHDGESLRDAVAFAIRAASVSVTRLGSQKSYPKRSELL